MRKSTLLEFMNQHDNWEALLSGSPYSLEMFREDELVLFKYRTGFSDMSLELVREARGIIIDTSRIEVVCWPFHKFFNIQEPYAAKIDWSAARVTEKIDGSIIKVWWHEPQQRWRVSTNTRFDAYHTQLFDPLPGDETLTYGDLFTAAVKCSFRESTRAAWTTAQRYGSILLRTGLIMIDGTAGIIIRARP